MTHPMSLTSILETVLARRSKEVIPEQKTDAVSNERELAKRYMDELSTQLTSAWDVYIKFYTVFLTANVTALALIEKEGNSIVPVVTAFMVQNVVSLATAVYMAFYSRSAAGHFVELSRVLLEPEQVRTTFKQSPIPGNLGLWAGIANAVSHVGLMVAWALMAWR